MRQLAAILFVDMSGYTALMQINEQVASQKRKRLKSVLEIIIPQYNGKILQYYGDGSLSIFQSAIDSVLAAVQIQKALQKEPKVEVRIGIHLGDIAVEEDSFFGDGVNLASRVESLAVSGSVLISEKIYDEIKNQEGIETEELGYFELKNIQKPIKVFAIKDDELTIPVREELRGKMQPPVNRLAVLPFVNMSADPDNEYFSDGITEELLNALTRVTGLQVTSRTSAFAFKGKNQDIRDIALRLNVDKVLEGSVRKAGNRVRVTAQLINATDGYHIWSENYDREITDIFTVQDEISNIIANKLQEDLSVKTFHSKKKEFRQHNLESYNLFLKGLHYYNKLTPSDTYKAIELLEESIKIDPDYAKAYALVAIGCTYLGVTGQMKTDKAFEIVHRYGEKALKLDNMLAEGYLALGSAYLFYDWKWKEAYTVLKKAIELNPASTQAYQLLAFYHVITGNKKKAVNLLEQALIIDPLSPLVNHYLGDMYFINGQYQEAIERANHLLEIYPEMRLTMDLKGWAIGMQGDWEGAAEIFKEVHLLGKHPLKGLTYLGFAYGQLGQKEKAFECIAKIQQREKEDPNAVMDSDLAMIWWGIGDKEQSIAYLYKCIEKKLGPVALYLESPIFSELQLDSRYFDMKRKLNLLNIPQ